MNIVNEQSKLFSENFAILSALELKLNAINNASLLSENWLTLEQACVYLRMSKKTLQKLRDNGDLGFSQFGNKIYILESEILAMLERNYEPGLNEDIEGDC